MTSLKYGGTPGDEQECIIRLDTQDGKAHVCSTWPAWSRKFENRHGLPYKYQERDGFVTVAFWTLPIEAISIRRPKTVRTMPRKSNLPPRTAKILAVQPRRGTTASDSALEAK